MISYFEEESHRMALLQDSAGPFSLKDLGLNPAKDRFVEEKTIFSCHEICKNKIFNSSSKHHRRASQVLSGPLGH